MKSLLKKLTVAAALLAVNACAFAASPAVIRMYRENGGLFGYRTIYQGNTFINNDGLEQVNISCMEPGRQRCKLRLSVMPDDFASNFPGMSEADFELIDEKVKESINETTLSGKFIFSGLCLVAWTYHEDRGAIEYLIYNREAAAKIGVVF